MEWCEKYQPDGIKGLLDQRQGGNRAILSAEVKERLHSSRPEKLLPPDVRAVLILTLFAISSGVSG